MLDQACHLRGLIGTRRPRGAATVAAAPAAARSRTARSIAVVAGKGGVGCSNIAINLAIALARCGASACVIDGKSRSGHLDLLCGLRAEWDLSHVLNGSRDSVREVLLEGPQGIGLVPGGGAAWTLDDCPAEIGERVLQQLGELQLSCNCLIVDAATDESSLVTACSRCDVVLTVTTPEPASVAETYALFRRLPSRTAHRTFLVVNQARSRGEARSVFQRLHRTARSFLGRCLATAGHVPRDRHLCRAVARGCPLLLHHPASPAARAIRRLSRRATRLLDSLPARDPLWPAVQPGIL